MAKVYLARVLGEDDNFLTVEIAKHDAVEFELAEDPSMNRFERIVFVAGAPWERGVEVADGGNG